MMGRPTVVDTAWWGCYTGVGMERSEAMEEVKPGIYRLPLYAMVNVYLVAIPDGLMLVDAGYGWQVGQILRAVDDLAGQNGLLRHVAITHGHNDHIGGAAAIQERTGAQIWMHPADARALSAGEGNRAVTPENRGLISRMMAGGVRAAEVTGDLVDGMRMPFAPAWTVIHAPGHTAGECCLYNEEQGVLITGDSVMNWFGRLSMPFAAVTVDMAQNVESVRQLAELDYDVVLFGHGPPLRSGATARLKRLVADNEA
jgi:glyoxylase-like metal-dependent hydrolase (beta-lactamase superfamily II)